VVDESSIVAWIEFQQVFLEGWELCW